MVNQDLIVAKNKVESAELSVDVASKLYNYKKNELYALKIQRNSNNGNNSKTRKNKNGK
jgi:hypothetical protein